jgi:hypothetical protein
MTFHFTLLKAITVQRSFFTLQSLPHLKNILTIQVSFALDMDTAYLNLKEGQINVKFWCSKCTFLTCICLRSRLFRLTLEILRAACPIRDITPGPLSATDTCIVYHVTHFEASRNVILHTRYVSTCVGAGCGRGRETKNKSYPLWRMLL